MKSWAHTLVSLFFSATVLYVLLRENLVENRFEYINADVTSSHLLQFALATFIFCLSYIINGHRYALSLRFLEQQLPKFRWIVMIVWTSHAFSVFLPAAIATDIGKVAILVSKFKISIKPASFSVVLDRIWGLFGLVILALVLVPLYMWVTQIDFKLVTAWVGLSSVILIIFALSKTNHTWSPTHTRIKIFASYITKISSSMFNNKNFLLLMSYGAFNAFVFFIIVLVLANMLGMDLNMLLLILAAPSIVLLSNLPFFYHGFGGRELAFLSFADIWVTESTTKIIELSLLVGLVTWVSALVGALLVPIIFFAKPELESVT